MTGTRIFFLFYLLVSASVLYGQQHLKGYRINVQIKNYKESSIYLGYYFGDKTYVKDTAKAGPDGRFVFSGQEPLPPGIYLIVLAPESKFFEVLIGEKEQHFTLETTTDDLVRDMKITGSQENQRFYQYLNYLGGRKKEVALLQEAIEKKGSDSASKKQQLEQLNKDVDKYREGLVNRFPNTLFAALVKASMPAENNMPDFTGTEKEQQLKRYNWAHARWFDHLNPGDPFFLRTPLLAERVNAFIERMTVQQPDSVIQAIEYVMRRVKPAQETYRYYIIEFLNRYAKSNVVGMDKVYVHMADKYYKTGIADWVDAAQKQKIISNAEALKPLLIGEKAPPLKLETAEGMQFNLHPFKAGYTILYFWNPETRSAKSSLKELKKIADDNRNAGVRVITICTGKVTNLPELFAAVMKENDLTGMIHTLDRDPSGSGSAVYNLTTFPQIFLLDENKIIRSKRITVAQLEEIVKYYLSEQKK